MNSRLLDGSFYSGFFDLAGQDEKSPDLRLMPRQRDLRIDFFRGLAMFFILISHTRLNALAVWLPGHFGFSDSADLFVFVSGYTAGIAYGGVYERRGWLIGTARVLLRCWQLYIAQLVIVILIAALAAVASRGFATDYIHVLQLDYLFGNAPAAILGIVTLRYVPHYLDILPIYIVALGLIPAAIVLSRFRGWIVPLLSAAVWLWRYLDHSSLPALAPDEGTWYFDPLSWQFYFIIGFSFKRGWLPYPKPSKALFYIAAGLVTFGIVVTRPSLFDIFSPIFPYAGKTALGPLRLIHFFALAYVATSLLKDRLNLLASAPVAPIIIVGRQALSVFLAGILLSNLGGIAFDQIGTGLSTQLAVNVVSIGLSFGVAYLVGWIKSEPWNNDTGQSVVIVSNPMREQ